MYYAQIERSIVLLYFKGQSVEPGLASFLRSCLHRNERRPFFRPPFVIFSSQRFYSSFIHFDAPLPPPPSGRFLPFCIRNGFIIRTFLCRSRCRAARADCTGSPSGYCQLLFSFSFLLLNPLRPRRKRSAFYELVPCRIWLVKATFKYQH